MEDPTKHVEEQQERGRKFLAQLGYVAAQIALQGSGGFREHLHRGVAHHSFVAGMVDWPLLIEKKYKTWEWTVGTALFGQYISTPEGRFFSVKQAQIHDMLQSDVEAEPIEDLDVTVH